MYAYIAQILRRMFSYDLMLGVRVYRGGGRGGREGAHAPSQLPKISLAPVEIFRILWLPPLRHSSRASTYTGKNFPRLGGVEDRDSVQSLISNLKFQRFLG
jgi:hypothetical protein